MSETINLSEPVRGDGIEEIDTLFVLDQLDFSLGHCARARRLAHGWQKNGYSTALLALTCGRNCYRDNSVFEDLPVYILTNQNFKILKKTAFGLAWKLRRWITGHDPKIIIGWETYADYVVKLALLGQDRPIVTMLGDDRWGWQKNLSRRIFLRNLLGKSRGLLANFNEALTAYGKRVTRKGKLPNSLPTAVIYNPVVENEFTPQKWSPNPSRSRIVIGGVGTFRKRKGFDLLIETFADLPQEIDGKTVILKLKGRGPHEKKYRAMALKYGLRDRFEIVPYSPQVESFYHSLDYLIVPTVSRRSDNVPLEAIMAGTPILASEQSGMDRWKKFKPWIFSTNNNSLGKKLIKFMQKDEAERSRIATAQGQFVKKTFDSRVVALELEFFLKENEILI